MCSMATRYSNPGYDYPVSRYKNGFCSAMDRGVFREEASVNLDTIRLRAKEVWLQPGARETTYRDCYKDQLAVLDEPTSRRTRPSSPTRLNNPHPPLVFLANRLHSVPGYHNADAAIGRGTYRVDQSVSASEQQHRRSLRCKFTARPTTAAVNQFSSWKNDAMQSSDGSDKGEENCMATDRGVCDEDGLPQDRADPCSRSQFFPSLHRYLKEAGAAERNRLIGVQNQYLSQKLGGASPLDDHKYPGSATNSFRVGSDGCLRQKRGDFLIHPEWPPSLPHHRLNGLSSPYFPGRTELLQPRLNTGIRVKY